MTLGERFRRWRATRGYGVHSPLAFRLLGRVVRPSRNVVYYGEEKLQLSDEPYSMIKRARLLLRLVAELEPSYVWTSPDLPELFTEAIRLAGGVIRIYDGGLFPDEMKKGDLIVTANYRLKKADLRKIMVAGKSIIAFDVKPNFKKWIRELLKGGVSLDAVESIIAVNTSDPESHNYYISSL